MDRRDFLKTTSTVIAGPMLAPGALAGHPALPGDSQAERQSRHFVITFVS